MGEHDGELIGTGRGWIRDAQRLVILTGAGVSAESGVATFRGKSGNPLWDRFDPMTLASRSGFEADPKLVYDWYNWRRKELGKALPNPAHEAIARLQREKGAKLITQNVDDLHERVAPAGAWIRKVHGTILQDRCMECDYREAVDLVNLPELRRCACGNWLRPNVVWFGEQLDPKVWEESETAVDQCDVLLVVGTSGAVYPAAGLVGLAHHRKAKVVVVNLESSGVDGNADLVINGRAGVILPQLL